MSLTTEDYYNELKRNDFASVSDTVKINYDDDIALRGFVLPMCNHQNIDISHLSENEKKKVISDHGSSNGDNFKGFILPSDILFSKQLPFAGIEIIVDEGDFIMSYSVCIKNNYEKIIDEIMREGEGARAVIGVVKYTRDLKSQNAVGVLEIGYGVNGIMWCFIPKDITDFLIGMTYYKKDFLKDIAEGNNLLQHMLITWYAIQISMLNPVTKELFANPKTIKFPIKSNNKKDNSKKRKVGYHKTHIIKKDDFEKMVYGDSHKINRKCLCWYVIGHWREYKNGNKVFIQGYWKGALRDTKKNHDEGRERIIEVRA